MGVAADFALYLRLVHRGLSAAGWLAESANITFFIADTTLEEPDPQLLKGHFTNLLNFKQAKVSNMLSKDSKMTVHVFFYITMLP